MQDEAQADVVAETPVETATPAPEPTEAELMESLEKALKSKDFKAVAAASRKLDSAVKAKEKAELEAKRLVLDAMTEDVKGAIMKALKPLRMWSKSTQRLLCLLPYIHQRAG